MKTIFAKHESLTYALNILANYEKNKGVDTDCDLECLLFDSFNMFMQEMKAHLKTTRKSPKRSSFIGAFRMLAEISFDKLEKEVMGVN
jgi:hypothetical protein